MTTQRNHLRNTVTVVWHVAAAILAVTAAMAAVVSIVIFGIVAFGADPIEPEPPSTCTPTSLNNYCESFINPNAVALDTVAGLESSGFTCTSVTSPTTMTDTIVFQYRDADAAVVGWSQAMEYFDDGLGWVVAFCL